MAKLFANSGDPDQMPHSAASDLGLHCLPFTLLGVSRLQWVKSFSSSIHFEMFSVKTKWASACKTDLKHTHNVQIQIVMHMSKVSSRPSLSSSIL